MDTPVIMLVEDDDGIREAYTDLLRDEGFTVKGFTNGKEALDSLATEEAPTMILLDWMMPVMTGEQFIRSDLGYATAHTSPVVVISAVANQLKNVPGVRKFLSKPVSIDDLLGTVHQYCG